MPFNAWMTLFLLGAIWGGSFTFLRIVVPVFGALPTACIRVLIAGATLTAFFLITRTPLQLKKNIKSYAAMALLHSAIPFACFAFAAGHIPAGVSVMLNGTNVLFTVILSILFLGERPSAANYLGLVIGIAGIALVSTGDHLKLGEHSTLAIFAGLTAAFSYALGGLYIKKTANTYNPVVMTGISQLLAGIILLPFAVMQVEANPIYLENITPTVLLSLGALAFICSAFAFALFYKLIARIGPAQAMTVGYLMPFFGVFFGVVFLHETLTATMIAGCALILVSVKLSNTKTKSPPK